MTYGTQPIDTIKTYQEACLSFAKYPDPETNHQYTTDGLVGEIGELVEKHLQGAPIDEIRSEIGDAFYYIAATLTALGRSFEDFMICLPVLQPDSHRVSTRLLLEACLLKNDTKKLTRDGGGYRQELKVLARLQVITILLILFHDQVDPDYPLSAILDRNIAKLTDRQARGVLGGSGDNR